MSKKVNTSTSLFVLVFFNFMISKYYFYRPKWQPVNKSAKSQPNKRSENKQENNLPKDATKRVEGSQVAQESSSHSSILDHSLSSGLFIN